MSRVLPVVLGLALLIYGLVDCLQADRRAVRLLPRWGWLLLIVVIPFVGSVCWLVLGRPVGAASPGRGRAASAGRSAPRGPEDDPDFLARLDRRPRPPGPGGNQAPPSPSTDPGAPPADTPGPSTTGEPGPPQDAPG
jgi:hypothetical protein